MLSGFSWAPSGQTPTTKARNLIRSPPASCPGVRSSVPSQGSGEERSPGRKRPRKGNMEPRARGFRSPPRSSLSRPPGPAALGTQARAPRADSRCGEGRKGHGSSAAAAGRTHRGAAAPLRARPAPPQRCERPPTPLLLREGSDCSRRRHRHSLRRRRRRRPIAEAVLPPRFRSSSGSRENFPPRPRPAPPPRDFPQRKRPRAQALLLGQAPAGRPATGQGAGAGPPRSRWHRQGSTPGVAVTLSVPEPVN